MLAVTIVSLGSNVFHPKNGKTYPNGEFYPLSTYPMYSHFEGRDYYVFLTDAAGEPVRCKDFGLTAPKLKKRFKGILKEMGLKESKLRDRELPVEDLVPVADEVLKRLVKSRKPNASLQPGEELALHLALIWKESDGIKTETQRVQGVVLGEG